MEQRTNLPTLSWFQRRIRRWMRRLDDATMHWDDVQERSLRFLEEATELVQSLGMPKERAAKVLDYVYSRPVGVPSQEVGGAMVTLAVLCQSADISLEDSSLEELERIQRPEVMRKILNRQAEKRAAGMTSEKVDAKKSMFGDTYSG